ncbi:MAG TPA: hypothetical protein VHT51_21140 [Micropepsaceae bacterium]|jgi:hypothetical protein|nr:hypothetical protein [Micropepsaceae bacterium]
MQISSKMTFFYKRIFPVLWFGVVALFVVMAIPANVAFSSAPGAIPILPFLLVPGFMVVFGYFLFRSLIFDLADDVIDEGSALAVRKANVIERIALGDIINVNSTILMNPPRITLTLRRPCGFGDTVSFMPPVRFVFLPPFAIHPIAADLIRRIDAQRHR